MHRVLTLLLTLGLVAAPAALADNKPRDLPLEIQSLSVTARPLTAFLPSRPDQRRFGALEWVGGLELSAAHRGFGGLSGLAFLDTEGRRFVAVSDAGIWIDGELVTVEERPTGLRNVRLAPMRNERDASLAGSSRGDAESITVRGNDVLVGFEATNDVRRYPRSDPLGARGEPIMMPPGIKRLRHTRGLESLAVFPPGTRHAGALLAIGESPIRGEEHLSAWIIGGPTPGRFHIVFRDDFHATDAAVLPDGDILLLERRVAVPFGLWSRLRRLPAASLTPGATVDGTVIFEADLSYAIDNMEGMALHRGRDGSTYVTMVSDDNFGLLQRTLLLRFRLVE